MSSVIEKISKITKSVKIGVLGPSEAGKTTLIRYLEIGKISENVPKSTIGLIYREKGFYRNNIHFKIYDSGGQIIFQNIFWDLVIQESNCILYLIDSTVRDPIQLNEEIKQFKYILNILEEDSILLILLNKQDLEQKNPIKIAEFNTIYPINEITINKYYVFETSGKYGIGLEAVIDKMIELLK